MGWNNNILTAPISLGDISHATGVGGPPYDLGNMIANGTAIKTWAKYKPFRQAKVAITETDRGNANYGLSFPQLASVAPSAGALYSYFENDTESERSLRMNGWQYLKPRGVAQSEWFRALDFDGYLSDAAVPIAAGDGAEHNVSTQMSTATILAAMRRAAEDFRAGEIDIAGMPNLSDFYFAVVGFKVNDEAISDTTFFVCSSSTEISAESGSFSASILFNGSNFPANRLGKWYVYPCLCSVGGIAYYQRSGQTLPRAAYVPLPCSKKWIYYVLSNVRYARLNARKTSSGSTYTIQYNFAIENEGDAYTFRDVYLWILHSGRTPGDVRQADEYAISVGDITLQAMGEYLSGWQQQNVQQSLYNDAVLYLTCSAGFDRVGPISPLMPQDSGKDIDDGQIISITY